MACQCPTEAELTALLTGELPENQRVELERHLGECADCRGRFEVLAVGDGQWIEAARARVPAEFAPPLREAIVRLKATPPATEVVPADPRLYQGVPLRQLGPYEILSELGRGGMGVVFRARQPGLHREVALKVVLAGPLASPGILRRFQIEAEVVAKLDHPHIVPIYEVGEHEGHHFFAMKLIEGVSLAKRLADFQALPPGADTPSSEQHRREQTLARLMADIAHAVHHAHQRGVLHRDLKPGNVLIDAQGQSHVTDFGLAKLLESDAELTRTRAVLGTPEYMSPEQAAGQSRLITTASDVYSLGTILYELLAGRLPFPADDSMSVINRVINDEPEPPRSLNPSVSRDLETICLKSIAKQPAQRYRSAEALAEDLERFVRGEPIHARPVSTPERIVRWCRRKPALAGALAGLLLVFVLGFAGIAWKWNGERHQRRLAEAASGEAMAQWSLAQGQRQLAEEAVVRLQIERAEALFNAGNSGDALAALARLLRDDPSNHIVRERLMNALSYRAFCLPVAALPHDKPDGARRENINLFPFNQRGCLVCANFSPDGRALVTAGKDGWARVWDSASGKPICQLPHRGPVLWAEFSPDGRKVVTASMDHTAFVWDAKSGRRLAGPLRHKGAQAGVLFASFSPDGRRVVTASLDWTAQIWDAQMGRTNGNALSHGQPVYYAAFGPGENQVLTAEREADRARLWNRDTGNWVKIGHEFRRESSRPYPLLAPDRTGIAVNLHNAVGILRKPVADGPVHLLSHNDLVLAFAWSPDSSRIASASEDATAKVWNADTGELVARLPHQNSVLSVDFGPDGRTLLTGSRDRTARLWDATAGEELTEPLRHDTAVFDARLGANSNRAVTLIEQNAAWLWDIGRSRLAPKVCPHDRAVDFAQFSPDGSNIVSVSKITAHLWDTHAVAAGRLQQVCEPIQHGKLTGATDQEILAVDFAPANLKQFLTATAHGNARVRNMTNGRAIGPSFTHRAGTNKLETQRHAIYSAQFSPDGKLFLTSSEDRRVLVWSPGSDTPLHELQLGGPVTCARFSPDGSRIVTASWDRTARIWDFKNDKRLTLTHTNGGEVSWADFDPTGRWVAAACKDQKVRLWSATNGALVATLPHSAPPSDHHPLDFNADGTLLATVAGDAFQVWSVPEGRAITPSVKHGGPIHSVRFNPERSSAGGWQLVTAGGDGAARIWDAATGHQLSEPLRHAAAVTYAEFSPDGTEVLTSSWDKTVRIWPVIPAPSPAPSWLPELAEALAGQRLDERDVGQPVGVEVLYQLNQKLTAGEVTDYYARWARWFLSDRQSRSFAESFDRK